jgi:hypothetical protein
MKQEYLKEIKFQNKQQGIKNAEGMLLHFS